MGGESSSSGGSTLEDDLMRAQKKKEAKERQSAFTDYQQQRKAASQGIDVMISPEKASTVRSNASLAMDFDKKAKESRVNVPGLTGVALSTISTINYSNIARGLRGGGFAVKDTKSGEVVGVVKDGVYSGNVGFDPIGRKDAIFSNNQYSVTEAQMGGGENDGPTETVSNTAPRNMTRSTSPTVSSASRRALISGAGGSAARRNLL
jgi:hypothetical protein|tara:strand:- start:30 stop:647 length:618 start_codon:yes stop_codon:yes gene_type:complete